MGFQQYLMHLRRLDPYAASLWGIPYALGYDYDLMLTAWGRHALEALRAVWDDPRRRLEMLGRWDVTALALRRPPLDMLREWRRTGRAPEPVLLEPDPERLRRYRGVARVDSVADVVAAQRMLRRGLPPPETDACIGNAALAGAAYAPLDLGHPTEAGARIDLPYRAAERAFLVAAVTFDEGWSATLEDGTAVPLCPTLLGEIGAALPPGSHRLQLEYRDPWVGVGAALSLAALGLAGLVVLRQRRAGSGDEPRAVSPVESAAMPILVVLTAWVAAVGLVVGSYLNVVIHRLPLGESTVLPRSRCPHCRQVIAARDNLPLVSFVLLRGRCRHCGAPISWRYPLVELATAALFVACLYRFGWSWQTPVAALFAALLVALAGIDFDCFLLPDALTLSGLAIGLAVSVAADWISPLEADLGVLLGGGLLWGIAEAWYHLRGEEGMGLGDAKMLAMIGAFLGWQGVLVTLLLGSLAGSVTGLALLVGRRADLKARLPFGVFLAGGAVIALFFGRQLVTAYARLL